MAAPYRACARTLIFLFGLFAAAGVVNAESSSAEDETMVELAWDSGCFNCHDLRTSIRGPAWAEVAERYRGDEEAFERLVRTVIDGGRGNWGDDVMTPNRRVPEEDVRTLVRWLLTLE